MPRRGAGRCIVTATSPGRTKYAVNNPAGAQPTKTRQLYKDYHGTETRPIRKSFGNEDAIRTTKWIGATERLTLLPKITSRRRASRCCLLRQPNGAEIAAELAGVGGFAPPRQTFTNRLQRRKDGRSTALLDNNCAAVIDTQQEVCDERGATDGLGDEHRGRWSARCRKYWTRRTPAQRRGASDTRNPSRGFEIGSICHFGR